MLDLVVVVGAFVAVLAAIGKLGNVGGWSFICVGPVAGFWGARLRATHRALEQPRALDEGRPRDHPVLRREDQVLVADLARRHKH